MRRNSTTWGMVATSGALVLTLAACGGDDSPEVEDAGVGTSTTQADADDDSSTGTQTDSDEGDAGGEIAEGEEVSTEEFIALLKSPGMDNLTTFTMDMDMGAEGESLVMRGAADLSGPPALDVEMEMPGVGQVHMIMVDGQAYMSMPPMTEEGKFIKVPFEDFMGEDTEDFTDTVDMTSQWDDWETGAQKVTFMGVEEVDGEQLNHYELLLDTSQLDAEDTVGMPSEITYDVWLDDQNIMRKVTFNMPDVEAVVLMDNWGEPVDISAPAESDITELPGMPTAP